MTNNNSLKYEARLRRVLDPIYEHIGDDLSLDALADIARRCIDATAAKIYRAIRVGRTERKKATPERRPHLVQT